MGFTLDMVGLVYFFNDGNGGRIALLPDGTNPANNIERHVAAIYVDQETARKTKKKNWKAVPHDELTVKFVIDTAATLSITSCGQKPDPKSACFYQLKRAKKLVPADLDTTRHDNQLPSLSRAGLKGIDPGNAETIAQVPINNGVLEAFQLRGTDGKGAIISRLTVRDHHGPLTITATPKDRKRKPRSITVPNGVELVLANVSSDLSGGETPETAHYQIYRKLVPGVSKTLKEPVLPTDPRPFVSPHPFFAPAFEAFPSGKCSNTCC